MPQVATNGLSLEVERFGRASDPAIVLIMGLATQMTAWPLSLCEALVEQGFQVLRFDNRDVGLSTRLANLRPPKVPLVAGLRMLGLPVRVPYRLEDMAADTVGLMDALDIPEAHVVGASMGGMIAQLLAAHYPTRVLSLTSIMSTTGHRSLPGPEPAARRALTLAPEDPDSFDSIKARNMAVRRALQSPGYAQSDTDMERTVVDALKRGGYDPDAVARQLGAIIAAGHRRDLLKRVRQPALVIHGKADPLVKPECGRDTAACLANSKLVEVEGMGHDLPDALMPGWAELIAATARRASA